MNDCARFEASIVDFLDASLASAEQQAHAAHLAGCARCTATLRAYRHIETSYRELPELELRPELAARVLAAAHDAARPTRIFRRRILLVAAGLALLLTPLAFDFFAREKTALEYLRSGDTLSAAGHEDEARVAYEHALAQAPADLRAEIQHRLAQLARLSGDLPRALTLLDEVCADRSYSGRKTALVERAKTLAGLDRTEEARQAYALALREFPASVQETEVHLRVLAEGLEGLGYGGGD
jgi:predicted negative regulator of RcsB-dependent stress response